MFRVCRVVRPIDLDDFFNNFSLEDYLNDNIIEVHTLIFNSLCLELPENRCSEIEFLPN